jgi:hypothetical protein
MRVAVREKIMTDDGALLDSKKQARSRRLASRMITPDWEDLPALLCRLGRGDYQDASRGHRYRRQNIATLV